MPEGWEYGNTRLRARRARVLSRASLEALAGRTLDELRDALAQTPLAQELADVLPRYTGYRLLQETLRRHLGGALRAMVGFYEGEARRAVELIARRWDLGNVHTLLRGHLRRATPEELLPELVPASTLDNATLRELASVGGARELIDALVAFDLPSRPAARALAAAWPDYVRTGDPVGLEEALERAFAEELLADAASARDGELLREVARDEHDQRNVLSALRRTDARVRGEPVREAPPGFLPGHLRARTLAAAASQPGRAAAAEVLTDGGAPAWMIDPLLAWATDGDLSALAQRMERVRRARAARRAAAADPLDVGVPLSYALAKDAEARDLRVLAVAARYGLPADWTRERLSS